MEILKVKLDDLKLAENNVRFHPRRQIEEYMRSLEKFNQTKNAVIDEDNNVLIGNGLVMAARELGWSEIFVIKRTDLSHNDKLKVMVSDNKIFGLGVDNLDMVDKILEELRYDLDIPGYDEATLNLMVAEMEDVTAEISSYGVLSDNEVEEIQNRTSRPIQNPDADTPSELQTSEAAAHREAAASVPQNETFDNRIVQCPECGARFSSSEEV